MPRYDWICETCEGRGDSTTVEVYRSINDYQQSPVQPCRICGSETWRASMNRTHIMVPGGRSERTGFPLRIPKATKQQMVNEKGQPLYDTSGRPAFKYTDVVLNSKADYDEWCVRNNKVCMMDGEADSTVNEDSTHSV